jgi:hypothetical protein|tara:strand:+ start:4230 stop:6371 length:2142 start_codon:yes stop_codon:yes gene_type:complete
MKFEIKETLAKLLATENLIVEHRKVSTASFDVDRRVLTLPMWERAQPIVYDLLVGHEVGHALYTPNVDWKKDKYAKVPMGFVNVVEDARIEKLMKRRYAGLSKTFYKGYQSLHRDDFFSLEDEDMDAMAFIDRLNLYYKIGAYHMISFSDEEQIFVNRAGKIETWEEVLDLSYDIFEYLKSKQEEVPQAKTNLDEFKNGQADEEQSVEVEVEPSDDINKGPVDDSEGVSEHDEEEEEKTETSGTSGGQTNEFESSTDTAFQENQEQLIDRHSYETAYLTIPEKIDLDRIILKCDSLQEYISEFYDQDRFCGDSYNARILESVRQEYSKYKKHASKGVNYLVKEFEMKKSANAYSRAAVSKTGVLDCSKLHTYKFNEDIFKKVTVLPDGKNHGLVFILDWSGSMGNVIHDTVKQLLNLVWFCKKVNIPFEVYAFTYEFPVRDIDFDEDQNLKELQEQKCNDLYLHKSFRLLNLLSHTRSSSEFDRDCLNLWRLSNFTRYYGSELIPSGLSLSGTPLNETIVTLHHILPQFIRETGVQKVNTVFLTDGESNGIGRIVKMDERYYPEGRFGKISVNTNCQLRDLKKGRTYKAFNEHQWETSGTNILLTNLKDNFPSVNFISYRVVESRDVSNVHWYYNGYYSEIDKKKWAKERSAILNTTGYDAMYAIASTALNQSDDFQVADEATVAQIRAAFKKSLKSKAANKKILSSFATMVA